MRAGSWHTLRIMLIISAIALIAVQPISVGFALPTYTATTVSSNNTVSAEYFTIGFYTYNNYDADDVPFVVENYDIDDFTPVSSIFNNDRIQYTMNGDQKVINNTTFHFTQDNLYLIITGKNDNYTVLASGLSVAVTGLDGATITNTLNVGGMTSNYTLSSSNAYSLSVSSTINHTFTGTNPDVTIQISLTVSVVNHCNGCCVSDTHQVQFKESTIIEEITDLNDDPTSDFNPETGNYTINAGSTYTYGTTDYGAVNISAKGTEYITSDHTVQFDLTLPSDKEFCLAIKSTNNPGEFTISIDVVINGVSKTYSGDIRVNGNKTYYVHAEDPTSSTKIVRKENFQPELSYWYWFSSDSNIILHVTNKDGYQVANNIKLDIILRPKS